MGYLRAYESIKSAPVRSLRVCWRLKPPDRRTPAGTPHAVLEGDVVAVCYEAVLAETVSDAGWPAPGVCRACMGITEA